MLSALLVVIVLVQALHLLAVGSGVKTLFRVIESMEPVGVQIPGSAQSSAAVRIVSNALVRHEPGVFQFG